jgi:hypothetical protein
MSIAVSLAMLLALMMACGSNEVPATAVVVATVQTNTRVWVVVCP